MLGSASDGERDNAARQAEQFRRQHKKTWAELVEGKTIYLSREVVVEKIVEKPIYVERPAPPPRPPAPDRRTAFHEAGQATFTDWRKRCEDLMAMGADPSFALLLVEMPDGHLVAGALWEDQAALLHIVSSKGNRARGVRYSSHGSAFGLRSAYM